MTHLSLPAASQIFTFSIWETQVTHWCNSHMSDVRKLSFFFPCGVSCAGLFILGCGRQIEPIDFWWSHLKPIQCHKRWNFKKCFLLFMRLRLMQNHIHIPGVIFRFLWGKYYYYLYIASKIDFIVAKIISPQYNSPISMPICPFGFSGGIVLSEPLLTCELVQSWSRQELHQVSLKLSLT